MLYWSWWKKERVGDAEAFVEVRFGCSLLCGESSCDHHMQALAGASTEWMTRTIGILGVVRDSFSEYKIPSYNYQQPKNNIIVRAILTYKHMNTKNNIISRLIPATTESSKLHAVDASLEIIHSFLQNGPFDTQVMCIPEVRPITSPALN